jgi:hypothetical protein
MSELLEITDKDIVELNDADLRGLIGLLCEAECRKHRIPTTVIQWGGPQDAPDDGIDISIGYDHQLPQNSYFPRSHVIFQSKVTNMAPALISKEMMPSGKLRESIGDLEKVRGAYVIVSRHSITPKGYNARIAAMKKAIGELDVMVDYYHGGSLAAWVKEHPSIILWVRERSKRPIFGWKSYDDWTANLGKDGHFIIDDNHRIIDKRTRKGTELDIESGISEIRDSLAQPGNYLRLTGLSGVGKTRLAQALFDEKIGGKFLNQSHVIYTDISYDPTPSPQNIAEQLVAGKYQAVLVIDNCSPQLHRALVEKLKVQSHSVSLLTIEYDVADDQPDETGVFHLEPSSDQVIKKLVLRRFPEIGELAAWKIAEFSGGNARVALALAKTLTPGESIGHLQDNALFDRLFNQRNSENNGLKYSAEVLSLVYSYDVENTEAENSELGTLGLLSSIPGSVLYKNTVDLRNRDLVQARGKYRAVLPHAIANRLAIAGLERLTSFSINKHLLLEGNERLILSFTRRLSYIPDSEQAQSIVEDWLAPGSGWMKDVSDLNEFGMSVFENLATIVPETALCAMERANILLPEKFASRENRYFSRFVRLLRHIAYDEHLFLRSANLMAAFAVTERVDENYDPIRRQLSDMFRIIMSGTYASLEVRLQIVRGLWESNIAGKQQLATELIDAALEAWHFQTHHNPTFGSRSRDYGAQSRQSVEIESWFTRVTELCIRMFNDDTPFKTTLKSILASKLRGLWTKAHQFDLVESICEQMTRDAFWPNGWFRVSSILKFDLNKQDTDVQQRLISLEKSLKPQNLYDKLVAYFLSDAKGMDISIALLGDHRDNFKELLRSYENLGNELVSDHQTCEKIISTLLCSNNDNLFHLGRGMYEGAGDKRKTLKFLLRAFSILPFDQRKPIILKGWINCVQRENDRCADEILEQMLDNEELKSLFVPLQAAIPIGNDGIRLLRKALDKFELHSKEFSSLSYSLSYSNISSDVLCDVLKSILDRPYGRDAAFEILYYKCHVAKSGSENNLTENLTAIGRQLLLSLDLDRELKSEDNYKIGVMVSLCLVGESAFGAASEFTLRLMRLVRGRYIFPDDLDGILRELVNVQPICLLNSLLEKGVPSEYVKWIDFHKNFEKYDAYLSTLPDDVLLNWCEEDPVERYTLIAGAIMSYEGSEETGKLAWKPIFWKLIERAPSLTELLDQVEDTLRPSVVYGSRANAYQARLALFTELIGTPNAQLRKWAQSRYNQWTEEIASARKSEQERDRIRNESFE